MICKMLGGSFRFVARATSVLALLSAVPASAALINPPLVYGGLPDVAGAPDITYDYVAGVGGTMTINGRSTAPATVGGVAVPNAGATNTMQQSITLPGLVGGAVERLYVTNDVTTDGSTAFNVARSYTNYSLVANFDADGFFTGGTVSILGYLSDATRTAANTVYGGLWTDSGTVLTGTLTQFGFTGGGGTSDNIKLQFTYDVTAGNFFDIGFRGGSAEYQGYVRTLATGGISPLAAYNAANSTSYTTWDQLTLSGQQQAFMQDFAYCTEGCTATIDTWVPLPGAVWLFGSGLAGLAGFARRRKTTR